MVILICDGGFVYRQTAGLVMNRLQKLRLAETRFQHTNRPLFNHTTQLGDFTFMKIYKILGAGWLAFCGYFGLMLLWQLFHGILLKARPTPDLLIAIFACAVYLYGMVASIFLFRGARWARGTVGLVAALTFIAVVAQFIALSFSWFACGVGLFALVSLVFLFLFRHESVA